MNASGHSPLPRKNDACKEKWGAIYRDFKCIDLWLHELNMKQHKVQGSYSAIEEKFEYASTRKCMN